MRLTLACLTLLAVVVTPALPQTDGSVPLSTRYREPAARIIGAALLDEGGWTKLSYLCDRIGNRLSGSPQLEEAVRWAAGEMRADGLENVRTLPVKVPRWVRGRESATLLTPIERRLPMLGLGLSVGTPPEGITAEVAVVSSFDQLKALGRDGVAGKMVLYDVPYDGYGKTVAYRSRGPSEAARLGAVAALVRSVGPISLQTPHTGSLNYADDAPQIPAAAITIEGAGLIHRLAAAGEVVTLRLAMEAKTLPDADSADVMGEIPGSQNPDEVVVLGGHLDSWDVGQGAQDDGAGAMAALQAVSLLRRLDLHPRRTIRVVLWTNEENGLAGARAYREWVGDQISRHVAAIEMDGGSEKPVGFGFRVPEEDQRLEQAYLKATQIGPLLEAIEAGQITRGGGGADISPLTRDGVPGFGLRTVGEHYFDWHHTEADTLDKVDPHDFRLNVAALAILAYVLADMPERLAD